jgi:signal transduction histidine kinase
MRNYFLLFACFCVLQVTAQPALKAIEDKELPLDKRYVLMKDGSQTYQNYKVIKENILDGFWKMTSDSLTDQKQKLAAANAEIVAMKTRVQLAMDSINIQKASMAEVIYDSTHITVLGIPFSKAVFLIAVASVVGALAFFLFGLLGRMKMLNSLVKEKALIATSITNEFEEFKKRAMEKQTKLSRELQNERNKIFESRK